MQPERTSQTGIPYVFLKAFNRPAVDQEVIGSVLDAFRNADFAAQMHGDFELSVLDARIISRNLGITLQQAGIAIDELMGHGQIKYVRSLDHSGPKILAKDGYKFVSPQAAPISEDQTTAALVNFIEAIFGGPTPYTGLVSRRVRMTPEQQRRMDEFKRQAYQMFMGNGGRGIDLSTFALALQTDEAAAENVLAGFGRNMMQQGDGPRTEYIHWDALPFRQKLAYFAGRGPWSIRKVEV
ncbi:MAG TPA: hypothetical protein VMV79_00105 [Alphaproteobacteria bacterium]|nr:hypothetical protein [Alphaproteobacteria bacterium]HUZ90594.1 hypothetical protein [Methylocella sp.]